ncbi:MAG: hypothetical protein VX265_06210 [Myxococcota bacterium]|nr:hypothetical protein [Myxococcota bacterium]
MLALILPAALAATPAEVEALLNRFRSVAVMPLAPLTAAQHAALASGEIVTHLEKRPDGHHRAVGIAVCDTSQTAMWLATQDPHFTGGDDAIEASIEKAPHRGVWYGMLDVPKPFSDRHWVIESWDEVQLAAQTGGVVWEHPWRLRPGATSRVRDRVARGAVRGLTLEMFDAAIETPLNEGALVFLALSDTESLFAYHVTTDVGGAVPERMVAGFVRRTMTAHIEHLQERARDVIPSHYRGDHAPVPGFQGGTVPLYP